MPIIGLSDRRRISRGGYIRLGEMKVSPKSGKEYPSKLDHFRADFDDENMERLFYQLYGAGPKRITIAFPSDDPGSFFEQWYKCYGASTGLKCKGDGESAIRWLEDGQHELPCPTPPECEFAMENGSSGKPGCKPIGSLQVFVRGLPVLKVFQINTSSYNSIVNMNSGIDLLRFARGGRPIAGVWVDLVLKPQDAQVDGKKVGIFVLDLVIPVGLDDVQKLTSAVETPAALPAPSDSRDPLLVPENGFNPEPDPEPEAAAEAEPDMDEVTAAFDAVGASPQKRAAMLKSAEDGHWDRDTLLRAIRANGNGGNGKPKPEPVTAVPADDVDF